MPGTRKEAFLSGLEGIGQRCDLVYRSDSPALSPGRANSAPRLRRALPDSASASAADLGGDEEPGGGVETETSTEEHAGPSGELLPERLRRPNWIFKGRTL